jgi:signal transduction histidine kinase
MWKKLLTVSLIFIFSVVILITLSIYSFQRFDSYVRYADAVEHHHVLITALDQLQIQLAEIETNQRAFLLFNDSSFYHEYQRYIEVLKKTFSEVHQFTEGNQAQLRRLQTLNVTIRSRLDYLHSGILVGYPPTNYKEGKGYMDKCFALMKEMEEAERQQLQEKIERKEFYESTTPTHFRIVFIFALVIFTISFGLLLKQYRDRLDYQRKLEKNIIELNQAHEEWEQISYVASHDLQEPLRKIRTFSDMLTSRHRNELNSEGLKLLTRIDHASARAQSLMVDIVNYNMVVFTKEELQLVDLSQHLHFVINDLEEKIAASKIKVTTDPLPVFKAYPSQITLLFRCLIDNSIKFIRPDEPGRIAISYSMIHKNELTAELNLPYSNYHQITVSDNGIGFEGQFGEKIFKMFQRLHPQESNYEGRGIGLAIVKRIMANHLGQIVAQGVLGQGAKFILYFPIQ